MSKWYESACAMCPYYKGEGSHRIVCDGFYPESNVHITFPARKVLEAHKEKFCYTWRYEECPLAKALDEFGHFDEDDEEDEEE